MAPVASDPASGSFTRTDDEWEPHDELAVTAIEGRNTQVTSVDIDALVARLTLEEKVSLLSGADSWGLPAIERLGIPALVTSDGPAGVRGKSHMSGRSVLFPCETALAATWDPELVGEVGDALGREASHVGVHVLLGPTVNIHRHPLGGRNFECFSEDPELSAQMTRAYITGVQSSGVACCVKHLVCNDSEFERHTISSEVDETTLREIYLLPFEAAVRAGVWSIMASYNKLNGIYTSEHPWLLNDLLRDEWRFDGAVISDWYATHTTVEALAAGLDIEMPGPPRFRGEPLLEAVRSGTVGESTLDCSVRRVLRLIARTAGLDGGHHPARLPLDRNAVSSLVRRAGSRGMVLLKNEGRVLPLKAERLRMVALIGPGADVGVFQGSGSAEVSPNEVAGILPALAEALGAGVEVRFERGCLTPDWPQPLSSPMVTTPEGDPGVSVHYHLRSDPGALPLSTETARQLQLVWMGDAVAGVANEDLVLRVQAILHPRDNGRYVLSVAGTGLVRVFVDGELLLEQSWEKTPGDWPLHINEQRTRVGLGMQAGTLRRLDIEFLPSAATGLSRLEVTFVPPDSPDLMDRAVAIAGRADAVVVVAESPHGWESEGRDRLSMTLPGGQDQLIEAVAGANPRTIVALNAGAPVAMPWEDKVAAILVMWFPGQEIGRSLADVLTGAVNPSGRLPTTFPSHEQDVASAPFYPGAGGVVSYGERFNSGYRHAEGVVPPRPLFPFGHGLSYASFSLGTPVVTVLGEGDDACYQVTVPVTHCNGPAGREVVQVYVSSGRAEGPALQLQGFAGVDLDPGETKAVPVLVARHQLRRWTTNGWHVPAGPLQAYVGTSATNLLFEVELPALPLVGAGGPPRARSRLSQNRPSL